MDGNQRMQEIESAAGKKIKALESVIETIESGIQIHTDFPQLSAFLSCAKIMYEIQISVTKHGRDIATLGHVAEQLENDCGMNIPALTRIAMDLVHCGQLAEKESARTERISSDLTAIMQKIIEDNNETRKFND